MWNKKIPKKVITTVLLNLPHDHDIEHEDHSVNYVDSVEVCAEERAPPTKQDSQSPPSGHHAVAHH